MRRSRLAGFGVALTMMLTLIGYVATPASAAPIAPDQWHCSYVTGAGDRLCIHLNQFLGWWTGFTARYIRDDWNGAWVAVNIQWQSNQGESGWLPAADRPYLIGRGEHAQGSSAAHLPSFACVSVRAHITTPDPNVLHSDPVTACRDN